MRLTKFICCNKVLIGHTSNDVKEKLSTIPKSLETYSPTGPENVNITTLNRCTGRRFRATTRHNNRICLNTFKATVYDLGTSDVRCFVWDEAMACSGACEITPRLLSFLQDLLRRGKRVIMYFDICIGQNKRYFVTMLRYALQKQIH